MRFKRNTDGDKRRRYRMPADAVGTSVPIEKMNMLQRIRYVSDYFFALAERERKKGDRADVRLIVHLMQAGALWAAKAAPYAHPKLGAIELEVSQPKPQPEQQKLDFKKLTDEEFDTFERLWKKSKVTTPDDGRDFVPPDEYQPSDEPPA
jgi:hypothetical protein